MTTLIYLIGTSVGPVIAGIFMQANQVLLKESVVVSHFQHLSHII
jgi:hypothetical protein